MSGVVEVRNVRIGEGIPKICVPIVGTTKKEILEEARGLEGIKLDVVEWRVDFYENVESIDKVKEVLVELREVLKDTPILFTFRSKEEGGERKIPTAYYIYLNCKIAETKKVDLIDLELFTFKNLNNIDQLRDEYMLFSNEELLNTDMRFITCDLSKPLENQFDMDDLFKNVVEIIHDNDVKVVMSNHDFKKTPKKEEIVYRLSRMAELNADLPKIAVMPKSITDVLTLLCATDEMKKKNPKQPIITMSMAGKGVLSRVAGEFVGSALTFGAAKKASAPGQMGVEDLEQVLNILHKSM